MNLCLPCCSVAIFVDLCSIFFYKTVTWFYLILNKLFSCENNSLSPQGKYRVEHFLFFLFWVSIIVYKCSLKIFFIITDVMLLFIAEIGPRWNYCQVLHHSYHHIPLLMISFGPLLAVCVISSYNSISFWTISWLVVRGKLKLIGVKSI